jgi:hypothetical protein
MYEMKCFIMIKGRRMGGRRSIYPVAIYMKWDRMI